MKQIFHNLRGFLKFTNMLIDWQNWRQTINLSHIQTRAHKEPSLSKSSRAMYREQNPAESWGKVRFGFLILQIRFTEIDKSIRDACLKKQG